MMDEAAILEAECERLKRTLRLLYRQAEYVPAHTLKTIIAQALNPPCEKNCQKKHSVAELADIENVSRQTIYNQESKGLEIKKGFVRHSDWREKRNSI